MSTHAFILPRSIQRRLAAEARRRDRETRRREETIATLARDVMRKLSGTALVPGDTVVVSVAAVPPARAGELVTELRQYFERDAWELWPSPGDQAILRAIRIVTDEEAPHAAPPQAADAAQDPLQAPWKETHRRMMDAFAADPALAEEFSAPLQDEPEDDLLRRAWAREFRSEAKPSP